MKRFQEEIHRFGIKTRILNKVKSAVGPKYQSRINQELEAYKDNTNVHDLPDIFHYVSNKYWRPKFQALEIRGINEFYSDKIYSVWERGKKRVAVCSVGAGNCDVEVEIAEDVRQRGADFIFTCIDINADMLERGKRLAKQKEIEQCFVFSETDINYWKVAPGSFDIFIANQSLHHFVELEILFDKIILGLKDNGYFLTMDMIGRNGHMRWPEALKIVHQIWSFLPDKYKYNHQLKRFEEIYENWDCSSEGFEGIRAQDILPLLIDKFDFELFLAFGNLVDVFIDRGFGHNYQRDSEQDRTIIDLIATLDECLIENGVIKPCHMVASLQKKGTRQKTGSRTKCFKHLTPKYCLRELKAEETTK
ncbi:class I SAM-dependent methyltransferase [Acidobacteria bacterium AH-259-O06]|nr:class I SAM-dependent methyltransferase [Acidobacteria bacterium AH-259-O06]